VRYSVSLCLGKEVTEPKVTLTVNVQVFSNYPSHSLPNLHLRADDLSRQQLSLLNSKLKDELPEVCQPGEPAVCSGLQWVLDHADEILAEKVAFASTSTTVHSHNSSVCASWMRYWLVSHHIYRKELIQKITTLAKELTLDGFLLCGKPGVICVEGLKSNCVEYWSRLRRNGGNTWKHINCKHTEVVSHPSNKLFAAFTEVSFQAHGTYGLRNDFHMDMGAFKRYLEDVGCGPDIYKVLFGIDS